MKYFTHKYNNQPFDFYIFGDRISTNLFYLDDSESPLIHNAVYTDIKTYLKQLAEAQNPDKHRFSSTPQDNINHINEIIQAINDRTKRIPQTNAMSLLLTRHKNNSCL